MLQWLALSETRCNARKGGLPYKKGDSRHLIKGVQINIAEYGISESDILLRAVWEEMEKVKER